MVVLIVVALVAASLISRLVWLISRRWPDSIGKVVSINAVSAVIVVGAAAYGSAYGGGPPKFYLALMIFGGAQLIVLIFDVFWLVRLKPSAEPR